MAIITLTTDFGSRDPWVASMKGVILSIAPDVTLVDISHEIPRHAVAASAYVLSASTAHFPSGTIHLAVVDPGVGGPRRPVVCSAAGQWFVGPDNGLFGNLIRRDPFAQVHLIAESAYCLTPPERSPTFQGRDVFAPVAAWLARGTALDAFGPRIDDPVLPGAATAPPSGPLHGEILWIDRFGNAISTLRPGADLSGLGVLVGDRMVGLVTHYAEGTLDTPSALINSDGFIEIFINRGDAAAALGIEVGSPISLVPSPSRR